MIFAIVTLILKGLGERIGVGVNFQNPYFFYDRDPDLLYRQYVGFLKSRHPVGPKINAHSNVTGGSSSDLNSPHFNDQSLRYTRGQFKKVHFYKNEVESNAAKTYHP